MKPELTAEQELTQLRSELEEANLRAVPPFHTCAGKDCKNEFCRMRQERDELRQQLREAIRRLDIAEATLNAGQPSCPHCRGEIGVILTTVADLGLLQRKAKALSDLRILMGYTNHASDCKIEIVEDDATNTICLSVGKETYYGRTLLDSIESAMKGK